MPGVSAGEEDILAFSPTALEALRPLTDLPFVIHLELDNPDQVLQQFRPFPADTIIACLDTLPDPLRTLEHIRARQARPGLSLNPDEPFSKAAPFLPHLDVLLLLGVFPGFGGQPMQAGALHKIAEAAHWRNRLGLPLLIAVDGGVNQSNAPALIAAGADILVVGTALFAAADMRAVVEKLRGSAECPHLR